MRLFTSQDVECPYIAVVSSLISLVYLHKAERNVDKLGLGFDFHVPTRL